MTRACSDCGANICAKNKSGRCSPCNTRHLNSNPELRERRVAKLRQAMTRPEVKARLLENHRRRAANPEVIERWREAGKRNYPKTLGSPKGRERAMAPETIAKRARTHSLNDMAWLPVEHREWYDQMMRECGAAEAKRMILDHVARELRREKAKLTPFERQMAALQNGGTLYDFAARPNV